MASPVPAITPSYSGFVGSDTAASLTTPPTCVTNYTKGAPAGGSFTTSCSGASDHNYVITYVPGILTVTPAPLTITASSTTVPYLAPAPIITPSYSGFVNGGHDDLARSTPDLHDDLHPGCSGRRGLHDDLQWREWHELHHLLRSRHCRG